MHLSPGCPYQKPWSSLSCAFLCSQFADRSVAPCCNLREGIALQELIYYGILDDSEEDILRFLMDHHKAVPRYNPRILGVEGPSPQLTLTVNLSPPSPEDMAYLHRAGTEDAVKTVTHWVVADLKSRVRYKQSSDSLPEYGRS